MRRMLDPKEVGGGRHGYRVLVKNSFYYLIYTSKDYDLEVGLETNIPNFYDNEDYKDLRTSGSYPVGGYYVHKDNSQIVPTEITLKANDPLTIYLKGLNAGTNTPINIPVSWINIKVSIIKLF